MAGLGVLPGCFSPPAPSFLPGSRLFEYRGRVSPVPRVVPVKRPRVTIPLVRRVKATLPVKLFARSAAIANSSAKLKREYLHGVQQDGVETGVNVDLPSPGVHPWGQMLSGKNLKKNQKHLETTAQARAFQKPTGCKRSRGRCKYNLSVPKPGASLHNVLGQQAHRLFWVPTTTSSSPSFPCRCSNRQQGREGWWWRRAHCCSVQSQPLLASPPSPC